jgi:glycerate kinase
VPQAQVVTRPMADGGEGTAAAIMSAARGQWIDKQVTGPLPGAHVDAGFVWLADQRTAVVEMASASGLQLVETWQRDPMLTTTYGTGQLIKAAIEHGARRVLLAVGGSATVDGGVGAAMALGWRFRDETGREIPLGGGGLQSLAEIIPPVEAMEASVEVLCDVDNPLCGRHGAARVYGPQKGASPDAVAALDAALAQLSARVASQLGLNIADVPGAGAAGGLAAGALAFMDAQLVAGVEVVMDQIGLGEALADADWVITGEGCLDHQSLRGKVVSGVARLAGERGARVAVIAGQVRLPPQAYATVGIEAAVACRDSGMSLDYALDHTAELLAQAARRLARDHFRQ